MVKGGNSGLDRAWLSVLSSGGQKMTTNTTPALKPFLVDTHVAAETLSISERTLWGLTAPRGPIPVVRIGRSVRYDQRDLIAFIDGRKEAQQ